MRRRVIFRGRVQGVGFRATARSVARGCLVTGWVRNEPDGTVLLEAQGPAAEIDRFLEGIQAELGRNISGRSELTIPDVEGEAGFTIAY